MSITCREEIGRVGHVGEDAARILARMSGVFGVSAWMSRGCHKDAVRGEGKPLPWNLRFTYLCVRNIRRSGSTTTLKSEGRRTVDGLESPRAVDGSLAGDVVELSAQSSTPTADVCRVAVLGASKVGKTTLVRQLLTSEYLANKDNYQGQSVAAAALTSHVLAADRPRHGLESDSNLIFSGASRTLRGAT